MNTPQADKPLTTNLEHAAPAKDVPPPLPTPPPKSGASAGPENAARAAFERDYGPLELPTLAAVTDALLKRPGRLGYELTQPASAVVRLRLLVLCGACLAIFRISSALS